MSRSLERLVAVAVTTSILLSATASAATASVAPLPTGPSQGQADSLTHEAPDAAAALATVPAPNQAGARQVRGAATPTRETSTAHCDTEQPGAARPEEAVACRRVAVTDYGAARPVERSLLPDDQLADIDPPSAPSWRCGSCAYGSRTYRPAADGPAYLRTAGLTQPVTIDIVAMADDADGSGIAAMEFGAPTPATGWSSDPALPAAVPTRQVFDAADFATSAVSDTGLTWPGTWAASRPGANDGSLATPVAGNSGQSAYFAVTPGHRIHLSLRGHSDSCGGTLVALCFHDASSGGPNCADDYTSTSTLPTASGVWQRYDLVRVVPEGMAYAYVQFQWAVWYDDVLLEDLDAPGHAWPTDIDGTDFEAGLETPDDRRWPGTWINDGTGPTGTYVDTVGSSGRGPRYATAPGHRYEITMDALSYTGGGTKWIPCFVATNNNEYWNCFGQGWQYPDLPASWTTRTLTVTAPAGAPTYLAIDFAYGVKYDNIVIRDLDAPDPADDLVPADYPFPVSLTFDATAVSTLVELVAVDHAGLRSAPTAASFVVDNTPPAFNVWQEPSEPETLADWWEGYGFAWSATDAGAGYRQTDIQLQRTPLTSGSCGSSWSWVTGATVAGLSWQSGAFERNHCYRVQVRFHDIVGNVGDWIASPALSVPEDPLPEPPGFVPEDIHPPMSIHPNTSNSSATAIIDSDESTYAVEAYPSGFIRIDYGQPVTVRGVLMDQQEGTLTYPIGGFGKSSANRWQLQYWRDDLGQYVVAHEVVGYAEQYRFNLPAPITARHWQIVQLGSAWDGPSHRNAWIVEELHLSAEPVVFLPPPDGQLLGACATGHVACPWRAESDPVNTATGNYFTTATDLSLPGRGLGFAFNRTYNSLDAGETTLGPGWRHRYDARLVPGPDGWVRFEAEDGAQLVYVPAGGGTFVTPHGAFSSLVRLGDGSYELTRHDQVRYRFDALGTLTAMVDRNANQLSFTYANGRLTTITDTVGRTLTLGYTDGRLTSLSGPPSRTIGYAYHPDGRLASVTDATDATWRYTYDVAGRLASVTDPNDHVVVTNEYGADGRITAQTNAAGDRGTFTWDPTTQTSTYTGANGGAWTDVYDLGRLVRYANPQGQATTYAFDADFNPLAVTDPRGHTATMTYDQRGNLLTRTAPAPLGYTESWTYTARNDVATYTDGRDHTTTYVYDAAGNLIRVTAPLGAVTEYGRDPSGTGLLVSRTDPRGKTTTFDYDAQANLTSTTTPLGHTTTMGYDAAGGLTSVVDPRGNQEGADPADFTTTYTYDAADRLLTTTDPLGHVTTNAYDPAGNLVSVTDPNQHTTAYAYDAANRLTGVTDAANEITAYAYDDVGNLVSRTDANDHLTTYDYDLADRLTGTTDSLDHTWTLTYDAVGNVATRTDANGQTTTYAYDELNRPVSTLYADPATPDVTLAYDPVGNLTSMTDGAGTETYAYDELDRLTGVTRGADTFGYGYDLAGNVTSRTYPGGAETTYTFDDDGRLASATADGATTSYGYDAAGNVITIATPDGYTARYAYDAAGRLLEVAHRSDTQLLSRFTYQLDPAGNRTAMTTRLGTVTYRYDDLNRLTGACWAASCPWGPGASPAPCLDCSSAVGVARPPDPTPPNPADTFVTYAYDAVGNRLSEATYLGATTYTYDAADRLTRVTPPLLLATAYTYDANGNQLTAGLDAFEWDAADRLVSASVGGTAETYAYAGDGRRLTVTSGGETVDWGWDLNHALPQLAVERDASGSVLRRSTYGLGRLATAVGSDLAYLHHDGLGSLVDATDPAGAPLAWTEYQPFGAVRTSGLAIGAPEVPFGFTGEYADPTGLLHLRARQYDPGTGRFLSTDPVAPLLTDPYVGAYVYVRNMPTVAVDPSGRILNFGLGAVGAIAGAITYGVGVVGSNALQGDWDHLSEGLNWKDAALSAGAGFVTGTTGGLNIVARVAIGYAAGATTSGASQAWNSRPFDPGEIFLSAGFGAFGGAIDFGSGAIGFFRGLVGGGGLNSIQNWLQDTFNAGGSMGGLSASSGVGKP